MSAFASYGHAATSAEHRGVPARILAAYSITSSARANRLVHPQASVRGDVGITHHVSLKLQVAQTVLDYITDADETGELAIA